MADIIGLIPAAGRATRLAPLPLSKELFPIGFATDQPNAVRPKVVSQYLLEKLRLAGVKKAFFILRPGKWDIPAYYGDGASLDMHLAYLTVHVSTGVPYTLNQAFPFIQNAIVAMGFPDILFHPQDAYSRILHRLSQHQADVVLGLFPTKQCYKAGMVEVDPSGQVRRIIEKPAVSDLDYMWAIAVWGPRFTQFMHDYLLQRDSMALQQSALSPAELPIGDVIQAAIEQGFKVEAEPFPEGRYLDVGTPDDLMQAIAQLTPSPQPSNWGAGFV